MVSSGEKPSIFSKMRLKNRASGLLKPTISEMKIPSQYFSIGEDSIRGICTSAVPFEAR
jgi:hypothetical protein